MKKLASAFDPLWYKDAVIYELHVRAFSDSNGDGIGDFPGLLSKLDYLQDLGVTCLWLLPFFPSPLRDDGYDISNYTDVNPSYGTLSDFKTFLDAAHQRNMQVMIELVINHTSDQHPWFRAARNAPPGSQARNMYVWSEDDRMYKDARIIFTDTEKSNWTWDEAAKAFYWHRFFSHQPDLNFDNPLVIEEVLKAMRFWLDMGVDALRMDAIPYLVERDGTNCENLPETHTVIKSIRATIDAEYANRLVLAEANQWPADVRPYFGDGDECHMAFHFPLMPRIYMALRQEDRLPITDIMAQTPPIPDSCQWGLFLRNHDELTLEMVTNDERDYMYFAYSSDPRMRVNVGIRRRLAPLVDNNRHRIELLNSLLLSFPGTPILYYGDEIGMGDNIYLGDRNGVRTPMQWNSDRNAGFSRCDPARLYFPVVMDPIYGYQVVNVEAQLSDQSSMLHWTRNMIALRKLFQVFGRGTFRFLHPENRKVLAYVRDLERGDGSHETVLCVANLSRFAQPASLDLAEYAGHEAVEMLGYVSFPAITKDPYPLTLAPYSFLWLELQPASVSEEPLVEPELQVDSPARESVDVYVATLGWSEFFRRGGLALLEKSLPLWLPLQRWFGAKTRKIQATRLLEWVEVPAVEEENSNANSSVVDRKLVPALLFVEVGYADHPADVYQIPIAFTMGAGAEEHSTNHPQSIVATLTTPEGPGMLHDATTLEEFRQGLLGLITRDAKLPTFNIDRHEEGNSESNGMGFAGHAQSGSSGVREMASIAKPSHGTASAISAGDTVSDASSAEGLTTETAPGISRTACLEAKGAGTLNGIRNAQRPPSRVGSAEQSNTSILYGDQLILKLFRRLQAGENPDVEVGRFLTEVAKFPRIPAFMGEISLTSKDAERTTLVMLQGLVANEGDGWKWCLGEISGFFQSIVGVSAVPETSAPSFLGVSNSRGAIPDHAGPSLKAAALLGRRTAEMHLALASATMDAWFAAEPFAREDLARDVHRVEVQLSASLEALKRKLSTLDDLTSDKVGLLLSRRIDLLTRAHSLAELTNAGQRIRIHGDYHLGQTLRTKGSGAEPGDFVILDFEGEPARPLVERRQKQSPLKDVAGMIRSLSYAAHSGLDEFLRANPDRVSSAEIDGLRSWAQWWQNTVSGEFLRAYRGTLAAHQGLLPSDEDSQQLLSVYLLEKALYELLYELNNRPKWLRIPLDGILAL